jgi:hypothetical protein
MTLPAGELSEPQQHVRFLLRKYGIVSPVEALHVIGSERIDVQAAGLLAEWRDAMQSGSDAQSFTVAQHVAIVQGWLSCRPWQYRGQRARVDILSGWLREYRRLLRGALTPANKRHMVALALRIEDAGYRALVEMGDDCE